ANLNMAMLRLPGTNAYFEVIEYQNVFDRTAVDPDPANPGTCHVALYVDDLEVTWTKLDAVGTKLVSSKITEVPEGPLHGAKILYCQDPDGIRVELMEAGTYL